MKNIILNRTKIIATIGPASSSKKILHEIILSGVDAIRLNFSHGSHKYHKKVIQMVRALSEEMNTPISIIQDLQGPKIRIGKIKGSEIELKEGEELRIHSKDIIGTDKDISIILIFNSTYQLPLASFLLILTLVLLVRTLLIRDPLLYTTSFFSHISPSFVLVYLPLYLCTWV